MSSNVPSAGHSATAVPISQPLRVISTNPLEERPIADKVQVAMHNTPQDRFELVPPTEARIQLLPKDEESFQSLTQEAAKSKAPFENLKNLAEQWIFPSVQHLQNKFSFIPGLKKVPAHMPSESLVDLKNNIDAVVSRCEEELDNLNPDTVQQANLELPGTDYIPEAVQTGPLIRNLTINATQRGYNYNFHRANSSVPKHLKSIQIKAPSAAQSSLELGKALGQAMLLTRHLVDAPANICTTGYFAKKAKALARGASTLSINVLNEDALKGDHPKNKKKMGLLLSVGQGNNYDGFKDYRDRQPRLVEMVHTPPNWDATTGRTILVVGKGVIFDTGGNNLKTTLGMHNMRGDMAGAAAVLGLMQALEAKPLDNVRVVGLMPLTENRISGKSSLPQNIYESRSGKMVEIKNTDAEGRLILADAMNYGLEKYTANAQKIDGIFDIATLTGGKVSAIGEQNAVGLAGNNQVLLDSVNRILSQDLRRQTGVLLLNDKYKEMVTEDYGSGGQADAINSGGAAGYIRAGIIKEGISDPMKAAMEYAENPSAFASNSKFKKELSFAHFGDGAAFLQAVGLDSFKKDEHGKVIAEETPDIPWVHFDIAGAEFGKPDPLHGGREWATGVGVPDLYLTLQGISNGSITLDSKATIAQ